MERATKNPSMITVCLGQGEAHIRAMRSIRVVLCLNLATLLL